MNTKYNKAVIAVLAAILAGASAYGWNVSWLTPELQATLVGFIGSALVYLVPNKQ